MKRIISLILSICFLLTACSSGTKQDEAEKETPQKEASEIKEDSTKEKQTIETDKKLLTVEIVLPSSFFEDEDMTSFDADAYAEEQGFNSAKLNDDGSLTVVMTKTKHAELMNNLKSSIRETFDGMIEEAETPYIKDIKYTENYKEIDVFVESEGYENGGFVSAFIPLTLYVCTSMYHTFNGTEPESEIKIIDFETNDVIESVKYPDALN